MSKTIRFITFSVQFLFLTYFSLTYFLRYWNICKDFKSGLSYCQPGLIGDFIQVNPVMSLIIIIILAVLIFIGLCVFEDRYIFKKGNK